MTFRDELRKKNSIPFPEGKLSPWTAENLTAFLSQCIMQPLTMSYL